MSTGFSDQLIVGASNLVRLEDLRDLETGAIVTTATVLATMFAADGVTELTGQAWPLALLHDAGTPGTYRASAAAGLDIVHGDRVKVRTVATDVGGKSRPFVEWVVAVDSEVC